MNVKPVDLKQSQDEFEEWAKNYLANVPSWWEEYKMALKPDPEVVAILTFVVAFALIVFLLILGCVELVKVLP